MWKCDVDTVLQTTNLVKQFGGIRAVDGVNLSVARGELHAIIGPNGAGKTTFMAQLAGELKPDHGTITFEGIDITQTDAPRRARLGLARTFQITSLIMPMTLLENTMLAVQATHRHSFRLWTLVHRDREMREAAMHALTQVGIEAHADCIAAEVSYGLHRQLEIAMALAMKPKLLLLDEPASGMGAEQSAQIVDLLEGLKRKLTIVLIEHDMDAVFSLADTVSVLVSGRMIATDSAANIRNNTEVQRAYLGED